MNKIIYIACLFLASMCSLQAQNKQISRLEKHLQNQGMIDIHTLEKTILVELKYATTDNFTKVVLYDTLQNAYLHPIAAKKLAKAQQLLKKAYPDYSLLVYDAARPLSVQRKMYKVVQGTKQAPYVAHPERRGVHNFGMAVDLTVCDKNGKPLDMGTIFDHLGPKAQINTENDMVKRGVLTQKQVDNRKILRKAMVDASFLTIRGEWWHFNAVSLAEAKKFHKVIE